MADILRGTHHAVLLFDGEAATAEGYARMSAVAKTLRVFGEDVQTHAIVPRTEVPAELLVESVLLDPDGNAHNAYGAGAECLYVIRPDGHVGYRSQPIQPEGVLEHLQSILI